MKIRSIHFKDNTLRGVIYNFSYILNQPREQQSIEKVTLQILFFINFALTTQRAKLKYKGSIWKKISQNKNFNFYQSATLFCIWLLQTDSQMRFWRIYSRILNFLKGYKRTGYILLSIFYSVTEWFQEKKTNVLIMKHAIEYGDQYRTLLIRTALKVIQVHYLLLHYSTFWNSDVNIHLVFSSLGLGRDTLSNLQWTEIRWKKIHEV